jgi:hypothetical protein
MSDTITTTSDATDTTTETGTIIGYNNDGTPIYGVPEITITATPTNWWVIGGIAAGALLMLNWDDVKKKLKKL